MPQIDPFETIFSESHTEFEQKKVNLNKYRSITVECTNTAGYLYGNRDCLRAGSQGSYTTNCKDLLHRYNSCKEAKRKLQSLENKGFRSF